MNYVEIKFIEPSSETSEILVALLGNLHYEGFEEDDGELKAFIPKERFDETELKELLAGFKVNYIVTELPETNWNEIWESNFKPVVVGDWAIRAHFHKPITDAAHEIIITPKMSFGTGHHATTFMMMQVMQSIDFTGRHVLDFGTGTGVLAIYAHKSGAASVLAIDNDLLSIDNASENFEKNNADTIELHLADHLSTGAVFDVILANITRNVILENFQAFVAHLNSNGFILLSGLLIEDEPAVLSAAGNHGFHLHSRLQKENWICLQLKFYPA
jgi:ribosomal protein L11 methyltransferase